MHNSLSSELGTAHWRDENYVEASHRILGKVGAVGKDLNCNPAFRHAQTATIIGFSQPGRGTKAIKVSPSNQNVIHFQMNSMLQLMVTI
jgi:hypothetical protein